jgi:hypothetical protein
MVNKVFTAVCSDGSGGGGRERERERETERESSQQHDLTSATNELCLAVHWLSRLVLPLL